MGLNVNMDQFKKEEESRQKSRTSWTSFEIKPGENQVRLLPRSTQIFSPQGDYQFAVKYKVHYNMFDIKGYRMIVCPETVGEECPICHYLATIDDKDTRGRIRQAERFMYNLLDLNDNTIKIYETGPQVYDGIAKHWLDADWGPMKMVDFEKGCVMKINLTPAEKSSSGWNTYDVVMTPREVNVTQYLPQDWEDQLNQLEKKVPDIRSQEELKYLVQCFINGVAPNSEFEKSRNEIESGRQADLGGGAQTKAAPAAPVMQKPQVGPPPVQQAPSVQQPPPQTGDDQQNPPQPEVSRKEVSGPTTELDEGGLPLCFGQHYAPRADICRKCSVWVKCRDAFVRSV